MSWCGVTDEWVEERGRGKHYCNTVWTVRDTCTPTQAHLHMHTRTWTREHASTHVMSHSRRCTLHTSLCLREDLIMVTPISERQHGGGAGRLWMPGEMSSQSTDTHLVATSIPICGACQSTRRAHNELTPPPLQSCRLSQINGQCWPVFFCTTYPLLMGIHAATMTKTEWKFNLMHGSLMGDGPLHLNGSRTERTAETVITKRTAMLAALS